MKMFHLRTSLVALALLSPLAAPVHAAEDSGEVAAAPAPAIDDGQIAQFIAVANQSEIDAGKLAVTKAENTDVVSFAEDMVKAHTQAGKDADALFNQLGLRLSESTDSISLRAGIARDMIALRLAQGAAFDRAYMTQQVDAHQSLLDAIDNKLSTSSRIPQLKAFITKLRPVVAMHLEHAKTILAALPS